MKLKFNVFIIISVLILVTACNQHNRKVVDNSINPLVNVEWLNLHLNDQNLVLLDASVQIKMEADGTFSKASGIKNYKLGHIPKAGFADLLNQLSADNEIDFIMPSAKQFKTEMEKLGVGDNTRVVLYSSDNNVWATRLWWMLRWIGFDNATILDGGLKAWKNNGNEISTEIVKRKTKVLTLKLRPEIIANKDEVYAAINNNQVELLDALPELHYLGQFSMYSRPGHIVSAKNIPTSILEKESGEFIPLDDMELLIDSNKNNRAITYCGGGISASSLAFNLFRLGYEDVAVYMGSLQEWSLNSENPMTTRENDK